MIEALVIGHLLLGAVLLFWIAARFWRILLGSLLLSLQLLILAFGFDASAHAVLVTEARTGFKAPSWEVVRKVRDEQRSIRLFAGIAGLGLFVLVAAHRRDTG